MLLWNCSKTGDDFWNFLDIEYLFNFQGLKYPVDRLEAIDWKNGWKFEFSRGSSNKQNWEEVSPYFLFLRIFSQLLGFSKIDIQTSNIESTFNDCTESHKGKFVHYHDLSLKWRAVGRACISHSGQLEQISGLRKIWLDR